MFPDMNFKLLVPIHHAREQKRGKSVVDKLIPDHEYFIGFHTNQSV